MRPAQSSRKVCTLGAANVNRNCRPEVGLQPGFFRANLFPANYQLNAPEIARIVVTLLPGALAGIGNVRGGVVPHLFPWRREGLREQGYFSKPASGPRTGRRVFNLRRSAMESNKPAQNIQD